MNQAIAILFSNDATQQLFDGRRNQLRENADYEEQSLN